MLKRVVLICILTQSAYSMITIKSRIQAARAINPKKSNNERVLEEANEYWRLINRQKILHKNNTNAEKAAKKASKQSRPHYKMKRYEKKEIGLKFLTNNK